MKEVRYFYVPQADQLTALPDDEASHATRVLRLKSGDELFLMDGVGTFYRAEVTLASAKHCMYAIKETLPQQRMWNGRIHLAIAPTKDIGRMEWLVEKATEVGFDEISFLDCQFSERRHLRADRMEKIVVSAVKQSRKAWKPIVNDLMPFREFIERRSAGQGFICHCYEEVARKDFFTELNALKTSQPETLKDTEITVLVGPEGDFSIDEVHRALDKGYQSVTLGTSRLRTETAGLSAVMMGNLVMRVHNS
jgi:16S rRNA (uracil1498-N3)-methyltransferase